MSNICSLCKEIKKEPSENNLFWAKGASEINRSSRILLTTDSWVVMPTIGPLKSGHLLIVSINHKPSVGHCNISGIKELDHVLEHIDSIFEKVYGKNALVFEHGPIQSRSKKSCCVDHAHVHAIPHDAYYKKYLSKYYSVKESVCMYDLTKSIERGNPYLYYNGSENESYIVESETIPSQFFRRVIASDIAKPDLWDWRLYPRWELVDRTIQELECTIPSRII